MKIRNLAFHWPCASDPDQLFSKGKRRNQKEAGEKAVKGKESTVPPCDPGSDLRSFCVRRLLLRTGKQYDEFRKVVVYNWGEYLDSCRFLPCFEQETGIDVVYEEFETNEILIQRSAPAPLLRCDLSK